MVNVIHDPTWLILVTLAVARLIRLAVDDRITLRIRTWTIEKYGKDSLITYFAHCIWCTGIYASLLVTPVAYFFPGRWWTELPILFLAVSLAAPALLSISELKPQITVNTGKEGAPWR